MSLVMLKKLRAKFFSHGTVVSSFLGQSFWKSVIKFEFLHRSTSWLKDRRILGCNVITNHENLTMDNCSCLWVMLDNHQLRSQVRDANNHSPDDLSLFYNFCVGFSSFHLVLVHQYLLPYKGNTQIIVSNTCILSVVW